MQSASNKPFSNTELAPFESIYQGTCQKVAFSGTSAQTTALGKRTSIVRLVCDHPCHVKVGLTTDNSNAGPTAVADGTCMYMPANTPMTVGVPNNGLGQIAVIEDGSTSGTLYVMEGF